MRKAEMVAIVVREWVTKAEEDWTVAVLILRYGPECPAASACFHAQQCVEKYLKALLVMSGTDFPKTHDLEQVMRLLSAGVVVALTGEEQRRLTRYATVTRYPGEYQLPTLADAKAAVRVARRVRAQVRKLLPKEALRRKRLSSG